MGNQETTVGEVPVRWLEHGSGRAACPPPSRSRQCRGPKDSPNSSTATLHDQQPGEGSWSRAIEGIGQARTLGFQVRVAATMFDEDPSGVDALHPRLDREGIAMEDRVIRPVAAEGFAEGGVHVSIDNLDPEPTITADGASWHPVAVNIPHMSIQDTPTLVAELIDVVRETLAVRDAAARSGREVFRCA